MKSALSFVAVALVSGLAGSAFAEPRAFQLTMTGAAEADAGGNLGAGDPDATGNALIILDPDQDMVSWTVPYQNVTGDSVFGFHIHGPDATLTTNKPVYINMSPNPAGPTPNGLLTGMVMPDTIPDLGAKIDAVLANPGGFYINLHSNGTTGFPGGAIRAQLPEPGALGLLAVGGLSLLRRRRTV